jgi:GDP-mannose transporter
MKALDNSNVETVIIFRACSPIAVTVIEYFFMDRSWPSMRSSLSLIIVSLGAIVYCMSDSQLALEGVGAYGWVTAYFFLITFEMTYGKKLTSTVKMDSVWGPVLYCNLLSIIPMGLLGYSVGEFDTAWDQVLNLPPMGVLILLFSCVAGCLIGYVCSFKL